MMRKILALLLALSFSGPAWAGAGDTTTPNLSAAGAAAGADLFPTSQSGGSLTKQTLTAVFTWLKTQFGTAAQQATGTSGNVLCLLASNCTFSGIDNFAGTFQIGSVTLTLPVSVLNGGSGTSSPGLIAGANCTITGSWPNQTITCTSSAAGSLTTTDGTHTVLTTTQQTFGNGLAVGGSAGLATINLTFTDTLRTSNYSVTTTDMGYGASLSSTGATLTLSATSTGYFQPGMTFSFVNAGSGSWTTTNNTGLTLVGMNTTTMPKGTAGTFVANANGTELDFYPGIQAPATDSLGGVQAKACGAQFVSSINADGTVTCSTAPGGGNVSVSGTPITNAPAYWTTASAISSTAAMGAGQILVGQTGAAPAPKTVSSDCSLTTTGAIICTQINGDPNVAFTDKVNIFTVFQSVTPTPLTDAATVTPDLGASGSNIFTWTIAAAGRTLANPTNMHTGNLQLVLTQGASTTGTITSYGTFWKFAGGGTKPTYSTSTNAIDVLMCAIPDATHILCNAAAGATNGNFQ